MTDRTERAILLPNKVMIIRFQHDVAQIMSMDQNPPEVYNLHERDGLQVFKLQGSCGLTEEDMERILLEHPGWYSEHYEPLGGDEG